MQSGCMSGYHTVSILLAKKKENKGLLKRHEEEILKVLRPLLENLIKAAALMTHRIIEESRWAKLLDGIELGKGTFMTKDPGGADPDSDEPHDLMHYTAAHLDTINDEIKKREAKLPNMKAGLTELAESVKTAMTWLETAMEKYAEHAERMAEIRNNRERRRLDRETKDKTFLVGRKNITPAKTTFKNYPEWDDLTLAQKLNIYRHSDSSRKNLSPLRLVEHLAAAEALDRSTAELRGYLTEAGQWVRCKISGIVDEDGEPVRDERTKEPILSRSSLDFDTMRKTINSLFKALKDGAGADEKLLNELDDDVTKLRRTGVKKRRPRLHVDWKNYFKDVKKKSFSDRVKSKQRHYKRDRLGRFTK